MKKSYIAAGLVAAIMGSSCLTSCIGSFSLTNKLLTWNHSIGNKFVNELVFVCFWILPIYEVSGLADLLVLNSIEFWSGNNAMAKGTTRIQGENGEYLVNCDGKGYTITGPDGVTTRLDYTAETQEWSIDLNGKRTVFLQYIDADHVRMPGADGTMITVETSQQGLYAYRAQLAAMDLAQN